MHLWRLPIVIALFSLGCSATHPTPVSIDLVGIRGGKPPLRAYLSRMQIRNAHDHAVWYVFPYWPDDPPIAAAGRFARPNDSDHILESAGYDGSKGGGSGHVVIVNDVGQFHAIRVPGRSGVRFDILDIEAWKPIDTIDVWEMEPLKVNGHVLLENWFPYPTLSDANAHIPNARASYDWENLGWDRTTYSARNDLPKEKVTFIEAKVVGHWKVPIAGAQQANERGGWK